MMDFTFPILLIAVLGCFYLHLGKKENGVTKRYVYINFFVFFFAHVFKNQWIFAFFSDWMFLETSSSSKAKGLRFMRRPMIVKGLGIVTLTEIALFAMFLALCAWYFAGYVHHWFEIAYQRSLSKHEKL